VAVEFRTQNKIFQNLRAYIRTISSTLTDFNKGSILNTILYAFSNGLSSLYGSLQNVYDASFVATATEDDLDDRVLDFNITRRIATRGSGTVTFFRSTPTGGDIIIPAGTRVKTITTNLLQGIEFQTTIEKVIQPDITEEAYTYYSTQQIYDFSVRKVYDIDEIIGTVGGFSGYTFVKNVDYQLNTTDSTQAKIEWLTVGVKPDTNTNFFVTYTPLSVDAPIEAIGAGAFGNVSAGTIINIPQKPSGVEEVTNYEATSGGTDAESDEDLRARVPLYLSSLSKSIKSSLKASALSIDGVQNANVVEYDPPNGYVTIFIDDESGGATTDVIRAVKDAIDGTVNGVESTSATGIRAAGIAVNVTAPTVKDISIFVIAYIDTGYDQTTVSANIETDVKQWLSSHTTGQDILRAELIEIIMGVEGVANIDLETLSVNGITTGDTTVGDNEVPRLRTITISPR